MNQRTIIVSVLALLAIFSLGLAACGGGGGGGDDTSPSEGAISGRVTAEDGVVSVAMNAQRGQKEFWQISFVEKAWAQEGEAMPLEGATVDLLDDTGEVVASTETDENGEFFFAGLEAGTYSIEVNDPSINPLIIDQIEVISGDTASISGTVTVDGGIATVEYEIGDCGRVEEAPGQLGVATSLAEAADVSVDQVIALREGSCTGWGNIAMELGVPPGSLGIGNSQVRGGGRPENAGPPEGVGGGRPDDAGPPDGVGGGRPDDAGPPEGVGGGRPDNPGNSGN